VEISAQTGIAATFLWAGRENDSLVQYQKAFVLAE
jgi:hypothetical protein